VARAGALAAGDAAEAVVHPAALARAERAWLVNALRGWVPLRQDGRIDGGATPA